MDKIIDSVQEEFDTKQFSTKTDEKRTTGWMSTKTVIRSRQLGRAFMGKRKKKENASDFRLFREKFTDENELSLNSLRVQKYMNNTRMKELARDNMPFMALEIHGLEEITLKQVKLNNLKLNVMVSGKVFGCSGFCFHKVAINSEHDCFGL